MTKKEIEKNCALGKDCVCTEKREPWHCKNWGRSVLGNPYVISAYSKDGG